MCGTIRMIMRSIAIERYLHINYYVQIVTNLLEAESNFCKIVHTSSNFAVSKQNHLFRKIKALSYSNERAICLVFNIFQTTH